jgi:putative ABC transport system permease protein
MELLGLVRRIKMLLRRGSVERTLTAEIRHHIDCEIDQLIRRGVPADLARKQALAAFGGIEQVKEEVRDARGIRVVEDIAADLGYAVRVLRHNPGFTIASVLTFGLGVGVATAIFSVVYGVLLRPLPYVRADRLMTLWEHDTAHNIDHNVVSLENFQAWRNRAESYSGTAALMPTSVTLNEAPEAERLIGAEVSPGYFRLLGVFPAMGRDFVEADSAGALVTILSDAVWKRRFGGDPAVVGRVITISGKPCTIVGVMPATFEPPRFGWLGGQALWFPMLTSSERRGWGRFLLVVGRLRDGVTAEQARAELRAIAGQLETENPSDSGWSASVLPLVTEMTGDVRTTLLVLLGAVALLLAIAVTNVGMLTLSAMRRRGHELAIRRAIGATDGRLFRQLFVQSLVLGVLGTAAGLAVAPMGVGILLSILPPDVPRVTSIHVDGPVLAVTAAAAMLATLMFGTVAAVQGRKGAVLSLMAETAGDQRTTARNGGAALTAVEVALAVTLGVMALLMVRTVAGLRSVDLGFNPGGVALARLALPENRYTSEASQRMFFDRLLDRVRSIPGVAAAGVVSKRPLGGVGPATTVTAPNQPSAPGVPSPVADVRIADAAALHALRVPLVSGRLFDDTNRSEPGAGNYQPQPCPNVLARPRCSRRKADGCDVWNAHRRRHRRRGRRPPHGSADACSTDRLPVGRAIHQHGSRLGGSNGCVARVGDSPAALGRRRPRLLSAALRCHHPAGPGGHHARLGAVHDVRVDRVCDLRAFPRCHWCFWGVCRRRQAATPGDRHSAGAWRQ